MEEKTLRTSFSQDNMFHQCPRAWYYTYVKKIKTFVDMTYMHAGTTIHKTLQKHYDNTDMSEEELRQAFDKLWEQYKLDNTKLCSLKENYWNMVKNGIDKKLSITSCEMKIFFFDVVGYLDGIDSNKKEIYDWKSSTRSKDNEEEYLMQLKYYGWLYKRKFGEMPNKGVVYYLKDNSELSIEYIDDDLSWAEKWHENIQRQMTDIKEKGIEPPMCSSCYYFCPYKDKCMNKKDIFFLTIKDSFVYLNFDVDDLLNKGLKKKFSYELKNAYFIKKRNHMANTTVCFWNERQKRLPIGFYKQLIKTLKDYIEYKKIDVTVMTEDMRNFNKEKIDMPDKIIGKELRPYQEEAVETIINEKIGMISLPTGSGKTLCAAELIRRINMKTLFIVNKKSLAVQTKKELENMLGVDIGMIGMGINNPKFITVGLIQTINKNIKSFDSYLSSIGMCVIDECHGSASLSYRKLSYRLKNTKYRIGLSATTFRTDEKDMNMTAMLGDVVIKIGAMELIDKDYLADTIINFIEYDVPENEIILMNERAKTGLINETEQYHSLYKEFIVENNMRNAMICDLVNKYKDKKILIVTKAVDHGKILSDMIGCDFIYGDTPISERNDLLDKFNKGDIDKLIGSIQVFGEGINIPSMDILINAAANSSDVRSIQTIGRVMRKTDTKKVGMYIDFIDSFHKFFRHASFKRMRVFKRQGGNNNGYVSYNSTK